jgi:HSP20 family protein
MKHVAWNPMRELIDAQRQFSTLFNTIRAHEPQPQNGHSAWTPPVDISEHADGYEFAAELPGINLEGVEVEVKDNVLTIKGERQNSAPKEGVRFHHRERPAGRFARVFRLPKSVDAAGVTAAYRDGVLSVSVPLAAEMKARKIPVQG